MAAATAAQIAKGSGWGLAKKGEITATFNIGDRNRHPGQNRDGKRLTRPRIRKTVLTLKAIIPQEIGDQSDFCVLETRRKRPDPKSITVHAGKDFSVKHIKVTSSSPDFQTKVEENWRGAVSKLMFIPTKRTVCLHRP